MINRVNQKLYAHFDATELDMKALTLKDGVLNIGTVSSVWSQELWGYKEELLRDIHREYGKKSVIKILIKGLTSF